MADPVLKISFDADLVKVRAELDKLAQDAQRPIPVAFAGGGSGSGYRRRDTVPSDEGWEGGSSRLRSSSTSSDRYETRYENRLANDARRAEREQQRQAAAEARIAKAKEREADAAERQAERTASQAARATASGYRRELRDYTRSQNYQDREAAAVDRERQATAHAQANDYRRELRDYTLGENYKDRMAPDPDRAEIVGGGGYQGGTQGRGILRGGGVPGLNRAFGYGLALREIGRITQEGQRYSQASFEAGNNQEAQLRADLSFRDRLLETPIIGPTMEMLRDPGGRERALVNLSLRSAQEQDEYGRSQVASFAYRRGLSREAGVAESAPGYERERASIRARGQEQLDRNFNERQAARDAINKQRDTAIAQSDAGQGVTRDSWWSLITPDSVLDANEARRGAGRAVIRQRFNPLIDQSEARFDQADKDAQRIQRAQELDLQRQRNYQNQDLQSQTRANRLRARGEGNAAEDSEIESRRQTALRQVGYGPGSSAEDQRLAESINEESASQRAVISRGRGLRLRGLEDDEAVTGLEAQGKGLSARGEGIARGARLRAAASNSDDEELLNLEIGENQLRAYKRQLQYGGSASEIAPGSIGPGFNNSGDQETTGEAINRIGDLLNDFGNRISELLSR